MSRVRPLKIPSCPCGAHVSRRESTKRYVKVNGYHGITDVIHKEIQQQHCETWETFGAAGWTKWLWKTCISARFCCCDHLCEISLCGSDFAWTRAVEAGRPYPAIQQHALELHVLHLLPRVPVLVNQEGAAALLRPLLSLRAVVRKCLPNADDLI